MRLCLRVPSLCVLMCESQKFWCVIPEAPHTPSQFFPTLRQVFSFIYFFLTTGFWTPYVSILKTTTFHKHDGIFVLECLKVTFSSFLTQYCLFLHVSGILHVWQKKKAISFKT